MPIAGLGVDISGLQQNDKPTRDVLVVSDKDGDREFVGFGSAKNGEFADCFLEADKLPRDAIKACAPLASLTVPHALRGGCCGCVDACQACCMKLVEMPWLFQMAEQQLWPSRISRACLSDLLTNCLSWP